MGSFFPVLLGGEGFLLLGNFAGDMCVVGFAGLAGLGLFELCFDGRRLRGL